MNYSFSTVLLFLIITKSICQVPFETTNLPIIVIDTKGQEIIDEPKIEAHMGIIYNGEGILNNLSDPFNHYDGRIGIELRGSSSQSFPKKSYGLETQDELGENLNIPLLGMPEENDWVLHGPYSDKSLMRNFLAYKLGRDMGRYVPRTAFCELMINGDYQGVYLFVEKLKRDDNRLDISNLRKVDIEGDQLTGGYIIKIDKYAGEPGDGWNSPHKPFNNFDRFIFFQYEYPEHDEIQPEQKAYIKQYIADFENALKLDDFQGETREYLRYLDSFSFIDYMIIQEITRNVDGYRLSTFFYKDRDSKGGGLKMGPLWDFNLGFGNADYYEGYNTSGWVYNNESINPGDPWQLPFWWNKLMMDPLYRFKLGTRWKKYRNSILSTQRVMFLIDSTAQALSSAQVRNFERWNILGNYVWPNAFIGSTYQEEIYYLKDWIGRRLEWLDANMPRGADVITGETDVNLKEQNILVFPNPFNDRLQINFNHHGIFDLYLKIYDVTGKVLWNKNLELHGREGKVNEFIVDNQTVNNLKPGFYLIEIQIDNISVLNQKIIKK